MENQAADPVLSELRALREEVAVLRKYVDERKKAESLERKRWTTAMWVAIPPLVIVAAYLVFQLYQVVHEIGGDLH